MDVVHYWVNMIKTHYIQEILTIYDIIIELLFTR
jgi:hypothetical protein